MEALKLNDFVIYPAIDLKDGKCVRLIQGDLKKKTVYNDDPLSQAKFFENTGFGWIHVVDLDGAFAGRSHNTDIIKTIVKNTDLPIQLGGGIRDIENIGKWVEAGIQRVVLGTIALNNPSLVKQACRLFPDRIAVGIDSRDGFVAVEGWAKQSKIKDLDLAKKFEDSGVSAIIHTDISRDGLLSGPNIEASANLSTIVKIPLIISGGVGSMDDLALVVREAKKSSNIKGLIIGRALYDGRLDINMIKNFLGNKC